MPIIISSRLAKLVKTIWEMHPKRFFIMEKSNIASFYSPFLQTSLPCSGRFAMALLRKIQAYYSLTENNLENIRNRRNPWSGEDLQQEEVSAG